MRLEGRACQTVPRAGGAGSRDARHTVQGTRPFSRASGKTASAFRLGTGPSLESAAGMRMAVTPSVTPSKCIARELDGLLTRSSSTARVSGGSDRSSRSISSLLVRGRVVSTQGGRKASASPYPYRISRFRLHNLCAERLFGTMSVKLNVAPRQPRREVSGHF